MAAAQAVHGAFAFAVDHPGITREWHDVSNFLVVVAADDEQHLRMLADTAAACGVPCSLVIEPDLHDQATAVALAPTVEARRLCANLALALKDPAMV